MARNSQLDEMLQRVEVQAGEYFQGLRELQEALASTANPERAADRSTEATSPSLRPAHLNWSAADPYAPLPTGSGRRPRRLTNETGDRRTSGFSGTRRASSVQSLDSSDEEELAPLSQPFQLGQGRFPDANLTICVQEPMLQESFEDDELIEYLKKEAFPLPTQKALDDVYNKRAELNIDTIFDTFDLGQDEQYGSATYEVYDVDTEGCSHPQHEQDFDNAAETLAADAVWDTIKNVNTDGKAVGRITSFLDPNPLMLGGIHLTMANHFDMNELFQHLVTEDGNKGKTKAYMKRAFEPTEIRRRSFFFVFKYYTLVGENFKPAPWQRYDKRPASARSQDHIDISESSSILALSLSGKPLKTITQKKKKGKEETGTIYDTFAPWHLLNIQCFPDNEHIMRNKDSRQHFCNGPYAFLDCLAMEYRDAAKRYEALHDAIHKLITPPLTFMFDSKLRDDLLFEDAVFTYSRRYFWAFNTLGVINNGIKAMISAYVETFDRDFWGGRHQTVFPHPEPNSPQASLYFSSLKPLRREIEASVRQLDRILEDNETTRKEIKILREQLFSGSSVKESRRAIEQGDNIKVLTSVSIVFLPLTFVTSVWSMTGFPLGVGDWQFAVTMVLACVPFITFVLMMQTRAGSDMINNVINSVDEKLKELWGSNQGGVDSKGVRTMLHPRRRGRGGRDSSSYAGSGQRRKKRFSRRQQGRSRNASIAQDVIVERAVGEKPMPAKTWWRTRERPRVSTV